MKNLENTRKKATDYRKEYNDTQKKLTAIEARIKKRCLHLCTKYPDVVCDEIGEVKYTAKTFHSIMTNKKEIRYYDFPTKRMLDVIEAIEKHIESLHPHQQGELFE